MDATPPDFLEKLKRKDAEALQAWVEAHQDDLFRFMRQLTRHVETAEDLTQQTLIKALGGLNSFEGRCSMRTWLHRIAFREYAAWRRRHRLSQPLNAKIVAPDKQLVEVETTEGLLVAIHKLPPAQRDAFLLFEVQQMSLEEVAEVTGDAIGTIKSRLHSARQKLRSVLAGTYSEVNYEH
jgi:RNA polymerase sigma-70 factor (ECF subfamily)